MSATRVARPVTFKSFTVWITCGTDGIDHAVPDTEMATRHGYYPAACGADFVPASMVAPPGPRCPLCVAALRRRASSTAVPRHRAQPASGLHRWLCRLLQSPTGISQ